MSTATSSRAITEEAAAPPALQVRNHALDGMRGIAVTAIVIYHFENSHRFLPGGWAALDIFFTLSGFLITLLLVEEHGRHGRINVRQFYLRRACRLLPPLLLMLAVWVTMLIVVGRQTWFAAVPNGDGGGSPVEILPALPDVGIALLYGMNWLHALGGGYAPIAHLWSLSVEEQFYLLWPPLLLALVLLPAARRHWPVIAVAGVAACLPWLYWNGGAGGERIYFGTDTRSLAMLAGAAAALHFHHRRHRRPRRAEALRGWASAAVLLYILIAGTSYSFHMLWAGPLLALVCADLEQHLSAVRGSAISRALSTPVLTWLGRRSYALYLWHYLWATWTHPLLSTAGDVIGIAASLACAELSWRLVEQRSIAWARRRSAALR